MNPDWKWKMRNRLVRLIYKVKNARSQLHALLVLFWGKFMPYFGVLTIYGTLEVRHWDSRRDEWMDYGLVCARVVTDAGVAFLVDDWDNDATNITSMNFHGSGTGTVAEAVGDTALGTEITTGLNPDNTRPTGTKSQPTAPQLRTIGTASYDASFAVTEHGIFSQAATGGGTLWDRSVFAAINVVSGDAIEFTYTCTVNSGG